jgi:hypothetical protein
MTSRRPLAFSTVESWDVREAGKWRSERFSIPTGGMRVGLSLGEARAHEPAGLIAPNTLTYVGVMRFESTVTIRAKVVYTSRAHTTKAQAS